MTRGNQRDKRREKNLKAMADEKSSHSRTGKVAESDAEKMRLKQQQADARKAEAAAANMKK